MADGRIIIDTQIDSKGAEKGIGKLNSIAKTSMKATAVAIAATGTALVGMGTFAIKAGIDFESAFTGVKKTVDGTDQQLVQLEKAIRNMAKSMPESASEIAGVAEAAGQLGIKVENIEGFTKSMVMLGDSTNMSSEEAATALARLANITQMPQTQFDRLGSVIVALGNNLATTESEITAMGLRLAGAGHQVGMSEAQILSFAGALSSVGIEAEAGGSAFSKVMVDMQLAVEKGGEGLNQFAKVAGMSSSEFQKAFKEDAAGAIIAFIQGLGKCQESGQSAIGVLDNMGITEVRMRDALLRAAGAGNVFTDALNLGTKAWDENTALTKEAETRYATMESQLKILKNTLADLGISFYKEVNSPMAEIVKTANEMIQQLSQAFENGGITTLVSELGNVFSQIVVNIAAQLPQMINLAVQVIQSFITGIQNNLPLIATSAIQIIQTLITGFITVLPQIIQVGLQLIIQLGTGIAQAIPILLPQIINVVIGIADMIIQNLPTIIQVGLQIIVALAQGLADNLPTLIENVPRIINSFTDALFGQLPQIIVAGVKIILALIKGLIQSIPTIISNMPQIIMAIVNAVSLYNWWQLGSSVITKLKNGLISMKGNIGATAANIATSIGNKITNIFKGGLSWGKNLMSSIGQGFSSMIGFLGSSAKNVALNALNSIKSAFSGGVNIGKNLIQGIWNGISNMKQWILDKIGGYAGSIISGIKGAFGIHSPSRVMRDLIGKNLVRGIGVGVDVETPKVTKDILDNMDNITAKMQATVYQEQARTSRAMTARVNKTTNNTNETVTNNDNGLTLKVDKFINNTKQDIKDIAEELEFYRKRNSLATGGV
ncbi:phage tail tape measure protein [Clostridium combesii]|uniref:Phage tail tape measure protein n=1 Tax=Clostridium combesii TaxID=39481 RepID=A0A2G7HJE5_9CLOT|nr:phage tail tape measure protein [Clostridium combesii]PIH05223.1 phage tail tape measure protein [Clostridium combesii]